MKMKKINIRTDQLNYDINSAKNKPKKPVSRWDYFLNNKRKGKKVQKKNSIYECTFANLRAAYSVRGFFNSSNPTQEFILEQDLAINTKLLEYRITKVITNTIHILKNHQESLGRIKEKLISYASRLHYIIPYIQAFEEIESWDSFLDLLENINANNNEFRFELFLAAISQAETIFSSH